MRGHGEKPTREDVQVFLKKALIKLYYDHSYIIQNNASERAITHHFANIITTFFDGYCADVEYNRRGIEKKYFGKGQKGRRVYPDIIIHQRKPNEDNLLAIEVSKWNKPKQKIQKDKERMKEYVRYLKYEMAACVLLPKELPNPPDEIKWEDVIHIYENHH